MNYFVSKLKQYIDYFDAEKQTRNESVVENVKNFHSSLTIRSYHIIHTYVTNYGQIVTGQI